MKLQIIIVLVVLGFCQISIAEETPKTEKPQPATMVPAETLDNGRSISADASEAFKAEKKTTNPHKILNTYFLDRRPYMPRPE